MRVVRPLAKLTYILAWLIIGLMVNALLGALGLAGLPQNLLSLSFTVATMIVGVRTFRGADEPLTPRRAWWRATATCTSSLMLGGLFFIAGMACWWGDVTGLLPGTSPFNNVYVVGFYLVTAVYYLHSGWRQHPATARQSS